MLNEEIKYFNKCHSEWLKQYPGKIALVKGKHLIGTYDTEAEALAEGARRYGFDGFLMRRIEESTPEIQIPALTLGLLNANSTRPV